MFPAQRARWLLALLLVASLAIRLTWSLTRPDGDDAIDRLPDQREYLEIARNLLRGEGLAFTDSRFSDRVYAYRTPGYPVFIAMCGANVTAVRIAQAVIDTSSVLAAFLLARRWLPPGAGLFAALLVAFNPYLIYFSALLLTETLFTSMLAWGLVLITSSWLSAYLAGGAILALSILVRPGALALPIVLGLLAAIANKQSHPPYHRRWPLPAGATMLLFVLIVLLPWAWRNYRVVGRWIWTTTNAGITAYDGFNPDATGASDQSFVSAMPHLRSMSETERNDYLASRAQEFRREQPRRALQLAFIKIARTWSPRPLSAEFSNPLYVAAALAYSVPFFLLALIGLFRASQPPAAVKLLLIAPALYLTLAAALSVGSLRYRIPAEVPISVLSASALSFSFSRYSGRASG